MSDEFKLLRLISVLANDAEEWKKFEADPDKYLEPFKLERDQVVLLYTCSRPLITEALRREVMAWLPYESTEHVLWPGPHPHIDSVSHKEAPTGAPFQLTITGEAIMSSATVILTQLFPKAPAKAVIVKSSSVTASGSFRSSTIVAEMDLTAAPPGKYSLEVWNGENVMYAEPRGPWPKKGKKDADSEGIPPLVFFVGDDGSFVVTP
jgi:hypothetical protein